jgi:hypothetical protein
MARPINRLTATKVANLKKKGRHADGGGLYIVVTGSGSKHWAYIYTRNGKTHEIGLGSVALPLADARKKAATCRAAVERGDDPRELRRRKEIPVFRTLAEEIFADKKSEFSDSYEKKWKRWLDYIYTVEV